MKKHVLKKSESHLNRHKFPNISRFITDSFTISLFKTKPFRINRTIKIAILTLLGAVMFFLIGISGYDLYGNYQSKKKLDLERQEIISKIEKWQGIANKYKDYRDAYFQLAILEYRLRDFDKSKFYLDKTLALDPNFEKGRTLEKLLSIK